MPNIKSAEKRMRVSQTKTLRNRKVKSKVRTYMKRFESAIESGDLSIARELYPEVVKQIDMATAKGVIHKNYANRRKSKLSIALNNLEKSAN
ncbi:MAG: 30S ribosomal protein S20 [Clostridiales bacterium]|nr:30S ribosomal protein S20 [Clostridiales bacterium]